MKVAQIIFNPEPGKLTYEHFDKLSQKQQVIVRRLVELGVNVRNLPSSNRSPVVIEVPINLAEPLNIEIGFLLNELASGDFVENLRGIHSCKDTSINFNELKTESSKQSLRFVESYPNYLKYYVYMF